MIEEFITKLAFEDELEKIGASSFFKGPFMRRMGYTAGAIGVTVGLAETIDLFQKVLGSKRKKKAYEAALKMAPEIKKFPATRTLIIFDSLWDVNPTLATNPMAAAGYMITQLRMGDLTMTIPAIEQAAKAHRFEVPTTRGRILEGMLGATLEAPFKKIET